MLNFDEQPLFSTSNEQLDGYLTVVSTLLTMGLVFDVAWIFWRTYRDDYGGRKTRKAANLRRREIYLFLGLAAVAFVLVNTLKLDFQKVKLAFRRELEASWREVEAAFDKVKGIPKLGQSKKNPMRHVPEIANSMAGRYYQPDVNLEPRIKHMKSYISKLSGEEYRKARELLHKLERAADVRWIEHDWTSGGTHWDNFKMLVSNHRRFWWTQQWFTGYSAWAVFVGIEAFHRRLSYNVVLAFIGLSYVYGLAGTQCLFYVLLLLKPKVRHLSLWIPKPYLAVVPLVVEAAGVASLPYLLGNQFEKTGYLLFSVAQAILILAPALLMLVLDTFPTAICTYFSNAARGKRVLSSLWFAASLIAVLLHLAFTILAYRETDVKQQHPWYYFGLPRYRTQSTATHAKDTAKSIFGALGDHHWIRAVGVDVILSAVGLCCWSVVSNADVRSMIKSSVFPWLDEVDEATRYAISRVEKVTEDAYDDVRSSYPVASAMKGLSAAQEVAGRGMQEVRHRTNALQNSAAEWASNLTDAADDKDDIPPVDRYDGYDDYDEPPPKRRGRPPKGGAKASTRTSSGTRQTRGRSASQGRARSQSRSRAGVSPVKRKASTSRRRSSRVRDLFSGDSELENGFSQQVFSPAMQAVATDAEAAGLTWGLFAIGGLGMASAAVFGGEEVV